MQCSATQISSALQDVAEGTWYYGLIRMRLRYEGFLAPIGYILERNGPAGYYADSSVKTNLGV